MKEFRFLQGEYPEDYTLHFTESIFNRVEHRLLQSKKDWTSFFILNDRNKKIEGSFHVHVDGGEAKSPYRAPFGSIEFSKSVSAGVLIDFFEFVDGSLKNQGIEKVTVKMPPLIYSQNTNSLVQVLLMGRGYQVETAEIGSVIHVIDKDFNNIIKDSERQALHQSQKKNFVCKKLPSQKLEEVYWFISKHQELKGYGMSMSFEELQKTVEVFKEHFFLFVVLDQQQIIAASVSINVMDHVLYNFYLAHDAAYKQFSPVIAIVEALYNFCKENSISIVDLGTSMLQGKPNISLLDFKLRLGGVTTEKLTLSKILT